ncbi:MAG: hydantoinase B/oxoprolinase family protein [Candidatus Lustribacter sp.]|jgi:N-methylhydantoinase B
MNLASRTLTTDPITAEIIRNALVAITDEMKTNMMRTAYNSIIYESLDFTVGLFDAAGDTTSIGLGLPMFIRGLSDAIKAKLAFYGPDGIEPGDILLTNDAYIMGSHLNHMIFTLPIFHDGAIVAFAASMGHWQDIGGTLGGTTQDIYSEGLQLPIVKVFKRGVQDDELTRLIRTNVRFPELAMGDFRAQVASIRTGEIRYQALLAKYGAAAVAESIRAIFEESEGLARSAVREIPDGAYEAESFMDDDGIGDEPIPIKVRVIVRDDEMTIDLSEVSPQVRGFFNSGATAGISAAQVAFKCVTTPTLYPINEGSFRPLTVNLPAGRVVSATKPAAMRKWMTIPMTVVDTVFKALAPAMPQRVAAGHHADLNSSRIFGLNVRKGRFFASSMGLPGGGWGAKYDSDGMNATVCINDGDTHNSVIESQEAKLPVLIEEYALRTDSGGAGEHRGGLGCSLRVRVEGPVNLSVYTERTKCPPWGLLGGLAGLPNGIRVERADGGEYVPPNGKIGALALKAGDAFVVQAGGGGGYGDPHDRPRAAVCDDLRRGYISRESALRDYGLTEAEANAAAPHHPD